MRVFISWSGNRSGAVAGALRDWLPDVIQALVPYVSSEDLEAGSRWSTDIAAELEASDFGIVCLTRENLDAPWLNFEAGAIAKSLAAGRVVPLLLEPLRPADVKGPLALFQACHADRAGLRKLLESINAAADEHGVESGRLDRLFDTWWPDLESKLGTIPATDKSLIRSAEDLLEEILTRVRTLSRPLINPVPVRTRELADELIRRYRDLSRAVEVGPASSSIQDTTRALDAAVDAMAGEILIGPGESVWRASVRSPEGVTRGGRVMLTSAEYETFASAGRLGDQVPPEVETDQRERWSPDAESEGPASQATS
jgi:hypothetical protein